MNMRSFKESSGAMFDAKRAITMCKKCEWDEASESLAGKNIDSEYQYVLKVIYRNAEIQLAAKWPNVVRVEEKNDAEFDINPECGPSLGNHKEHRSSFTLETEINNVPVRRRYKGLHGRPRKNVIQNEGDNIDQARPTEKEVRGRPTKPMIEKESDQNIDQAPPTKKRGRGRPRKQVIENEGEKVDQVGPSGKGVRGRLRKRPIENEVQLGKGAATNSLLNEKNSYVIKEENEGTYDSDDSSVVILDSAKICKEGDLSAFVASTIDKTERSNVRSDYRERVLDVLKKPYDIDEYRKLRKAVESYIIYHPDLKGKLKKYRYNRGKLLTILRGFFFWLEKVTQKDSFKPWLDGECLAIKPAGSK